MQRRGGRWSRGTRLISLDSLAGNRENEYSLEGDCLPLTGFSGHPLARTGVRGYTTSCRAVVWGRCPVGQIAFDGRFRPGLAEKVNYRRAYSGRVNHESHITDQRRGLEHIGYFRDNFGIWHISDPFQMAHMIVGLLVHRCHHMRGSGRGGGEHRPAVRLDIAEALFAADRRGRGARRLTTGAASENAAEVLTRTRVLRSAICSLLH